MPASSRQGETTSCSWHAEDAVGLLVNNAGFGLPRPFEQNAVDEELGMLELLVAVPLRLTHAALGQMLPRQRGMIVNIASVAGFVRTEFHRRMDVGTEGIPDFLWLQAEQLVRIALRDVANGKAVSIPTARYKVIVALSRVLPTRLVVGTARLGR